MPAQKNKILLPFFSRDPESMSLDQRLFGQTTMDLFGPSIIERAKTVSQLPSKPALPFKPPGDWRQAAKNVNLSNANTKRAGSAPKIRAQDRALLTTPFPLHHQKQIALCTHCKRPFLAQVFDQHMSSCTRAPTRRTSLHGTRASIDATADATAQTDNSDVDVKPPSKKRKVDQQAQSAKAKRQKPKPKSKPKTPFNIDKQCGVLNPSTGQPCTRSLTCKAHSMGAKRAVQGRSQPYDTLLIQYQRTNIVKQASISTREAQQESEPEEEVITPERELTQIMDGICHSHCAPLDRKVLLPTRTRNQIRIREMLSLAMLPRELNASGDAIFGRALAFCSDPPYTLQFVRSPAQRYHAQKAMMHKRRQEAAQAQAAQAQAQAQAQRRK